MKKLLASSIKSKKKNKPKKKRGAHAANGAEGDEVVKEKELEEAREGIRPSRPCPDQRQRSVAPAAGSGLVFKSHLRPSHKA